MCAALISIHVLALKDPVRVGKARIDGIPSDVVRLEQTVSVSCHLHVLPILGAAGIEQFVIQLELALHMLARHVCHLELTDVQDRLMGYD